MVNHLEKKKFFYKRNFGRDLERSREELGMNGYDLARELNISPTAIHKWENGTSFPAPGKWKAIKGLTNINPQDYIDYDSKSKHKTFNDLDDILAETGGEIPSFAPEILKYPEMMNRAPYYKFFDTDMTRAAMHPIRVPFLPWVNLENGDPVNDLMPSYDSDIWICYSTTKSKHVFALLVQNDSMEPEFFKGDIIVVDPEKKAANGSYIIARNGTETTLKQYVTDGASVFLKPVNDRYPIRDMTGVDFQIIGVVIEKRKRYVWDL